MANEGLVTRRGQDCVLLQDVCGIQDGACAMTDTDINIYRINEPCTAAASLSSQLLNSCQTPTEILLQSVLIFYGFRSQSASSTRKEAGGMRARSSCFKLL